MRTHWKFPLKITGVQTVKMDPGAELFEAHLDHEDRLMLWARVDDGAEPKPWRVRIFGTGHPVIGAERVFGGGIFVGTVVMAHGYVWHIYVESPPT